MEKRETPEKNAIAHALINICPYATHNTTDRLANPHCHSSADSHSPSRPSQKLVAEDRSEDILRYLELCTFTAEFGRPVRILLEIVTRDCRPRGLDGANEILDGQGWFEKLLGFDFHPGHFHGTCVAGRAGSQLFDAV